LKSVERRRNLKLQLRIRRTNV